MNINRNDFFNFQETANRFDGYWKITKKGSFFKIQGSLKQDSKIHLTFATQTFAQWFFSNVVDVFTFGFIKDFFKNEVSLDCNCTANIEEVKALITAGYQEIISKDSVTQAVDDVSRRWLDTLSLTPLQALYAQKLKSTTIAIVTDVLKFFSDPRIQASTPDELKQILEIAQKDFPQMMDERTSKFFEGVMKAVDSFIDNLKGMKEAFDKLALASGEPDIRNKLLRFIAFGHIKNLMNELDRENAAIVNQMI